MSTCFADNTNHPPNVLPFSIYKNLALPLRVSLGLAKNETEQRLRRALEDVWLWEEVKDRLHDNALTLSGGQQQRFCLARALAMDPTILLLDEPTASLDCKATQKIEALFQTLKKRYAILAVTHSLSQMRRLADRVVALRDGELVSELSRSELADQESAGASWRKYSEATLTGGADEPSDVLPLLSRARIARRNDQARNRGGWVSRISALCSTLHSFLFRNCRVITLHILQTAKCRVTGWPFPKPLMKTEDTCFPIARN